MLKNAEAFKIIMNHYEPYYEYYESYNKLYNIINHIMNHCVPIAEQINSEKKYNMLHYNFITF